MLESERVCGDMVVKGREEADFDAPSVGARSDNEGEPDNVDLAEIEESCTLMKRA